MFHVLSEISWSGILLAFVAYFILGALWFTLFFPKQYRISLGRESEVQQKPAPIFIIGPAICSLVITLATSTLIYALKIDSYDNALVFAAIVGVGYLVANTVNIAINPNMPFPLHYSLISGTYHLAGIVLVCLITVAMK